MKKYFVISIVILFMGKAFPTGINTGTISIDMDLYGRIQLYQPDLTNELKLNLYSLSILIGTSPSTVYNYWLDAGIQDSTRTFYDSAAGLSGLYGAFNNSFSNLPPNVLVKTFVTALDGSSNVIIKYVIINRESFIINALPAFEIISQIDGIEGFDTVKYIDSLKIIDIYKQNHLGFRPLSGNLKSLTSFEFFNGYENDSSYYQWMTHDTLDAQYNSGPDGPVTIASQDFQNISPGDSISVYLSMALGSSFSEVINGLDSALARYNNYLTTVKGNESFSPIGFKLNQNYPNPFNPSTVISFSIPVQEKVSLKVYNILGMEVSTMLNEVRTAGNYSIRFDAKNLPSGIYFYELMTGNFRDVRKMILLK